MSPENGDTTEKELTTKVTSIAQEELDTGVKIETPSAEELVSRASMALIVNLKMFNQAFMPLKSRAKQRVMNAVLDLPANGVPVYLRSDAEKECFGLGQRVIADRFIITQHHIIKEAKRIKALKEAEEEKTKEEEKTIDTNKEIE